MTELVVICLVKQNKPRMGAHTQNMMSQPNYGPLNSLLIEEQFHRSFHAYGVLQLSRKIKGQETSLMILI